MSESINDIFKFLDIRGRIFRNREILRYSYIPDTLPHREKEIRTVARILFPALNGDTPSNIIIYGMTGTGKTVVSKLIMKAISEKSRRMNAEAIETFCSTTSGYIDGDISDMLLQASHLEEQENLMGKELLGILHKPVKCIYINCQQMDTQYRVFTQIANRLTPFSDEDRLPVSGLPIDEVHDRLVRKLDEMGYIVIVILDEIDRLVYKSGDDLLYTLTRINEELDCARVSIIGISNNLKILEYIDPRVKSSLGAEELVFKPYNAHQLTDILKERAKEAFYDETVNEDLIAHCAALAAQENGDARRALDMLRVSAELAERDQSSAITDVYLRQAQKRIEMDRVSQVVRSLPLQTKMILYSILQMKISGRVKTTTKEVVEAYSMYAQKLELTILGRRQVVNLMGELDKLGLIQTKVISFGRHGRTTVVEASIPATDIINQLHMGYLSKLKGIRPRLMYNTSF